MNLITMSRTHILARAAKKMAESFTPPAKRNYSENRGPRNVALLTGITGQVLHS